MALAYEGPGHGSLPPCSEPQGQEQFRGSFSSVIEFFANTEYSYMSLVTQKIKN